MKNKFSLCQRGPVFYLLEVEPRRRTSLRTTDRAAAEQILRAKNEVAGKPALDLALGRACFSAAGADQNENSSGPRFLDWPGRVAPACLAAVQAQAKALRKRTLSGARTQG